jgi:membrane protein CcdC involved in cytochrome C biogenesis
MTKNYLFPSKFQKLGWILLIPFGLLFLYFCFTTSGSRIELKVPIFAIVDDNNFLENSKIWFSLINNDIMDEITSIGLIISLLLIAFSKERDEDEYISQIRANSLVWALLINFSILIFCELFIYGMFFFEILCGNLFLILILFVLKFKINVYKLRKSMKNEE